MTASIKNFRVLQLNVHVDDDICEGSQIVMESSQQIEIKVPKNADDPTIMLEVSSEIISKDRRFHISCKSQFIFMFDSVQEDWRKAVNDCCHVPVHNRIGQLIEEILQSTGHLLK